jgi:DNA-directed RNA polymerase specialized sigma24 family protein
MGDSRYGGPAGMANPAEIADAYDSYAEQLYAYCRFLLPDPAGAMSALEGTFLVAAGRLAVLPADGQLRTWLFAIARNECLRRAGSRPAARAPGREPVGPAGGHEGRALLRGAVEGLAAGERDLIAMLLHGLEIDGIAAVLGIAREGAVPRISRALVELETATVDLLVARSGRGGCADLAALLGDWDGHLNVPLTRKLGHHIERCRACSARRQGELRPALLLSLTPGALLGAAVTAEALRPVAETVGKFRDQVLSQACDQSPEGDEKRGRACSRADPFGKNGFPRALRADARGVLRTPRLSVVAGLAVAAAVTLAASVTLAVEHGWAPAGDTGLAGLGRPPASAPATTGSASAPSPADSTSPARPSRSPSPSAIPSSASPSPTPSVPPSSSAPPSASQSPSAMPSPVLHVPSSVTLQNMGQRQWQGTLTVTVDSGSLAWSISNPNQSLQLSQDAGTSSASVQITGWYHNDRQPLTVTVGNKSYTVALVPASD